METKPNFILPLPDACAELSLVGGKGASLARMAAAGLPVPPGFHITTAAYRRFVAEHGLQEQILAAVSAATPDQPVTLEEASSRIGKLFAQHAMPDDISEAIRRAYVELGAYAELGEGGAHGDGRSSATAEDLPEMSFAGQQETYLNIQGAEAVLEAVKKCWASLWTARAIGYRARHNIAPQDVSLAVVVQVLVPADATGILFTANPLTGARNQVMINAAWGLGEAIVGGHVTPDTVVVDKAKGSNPYTRQGAQERQRQQAEQAISQRIGPLRRRWFQKLLISAQECATERENAIANIGLPYPQLRRLLRELGLRLAAGGAIAQPEDIYWLEAQEADVLAAALEANEPLSCHAASVEARKAGWQRARKAAPPTVLPENHLLAKMFSPNKPQINLLKGKGTSAGQVTAPACVLRGPDDFGQMHPGDVLVAVATTPAWTPLFAMASAVVTDIGGPLSHSSIVAREYGIPAVMATGVATRLIHTGQMITVDGTIGTVTLGAVGGLYPAWRAANESGGSVAVRAVGATVNIDPSVEQKEKSNKTHGVIRWLIRETMGVLGQAVVLFLSVGRWNWVMGWAFVILTALWVGATALVVIPRNPDLLAERLGPRKGAKTWDAMIMSIVGLALIACYIVAGLDVGNEWTTGISPLLQVAALVIVVLGYALTVWATAANPFFSLIVRVQKERRHTVVTGGPYQFVRHPAYVGGVALYLATPVMLGSLWALIPGGLPALLMIVRTALEDKMLLTELDGYKDYAQRVRYRLLPGIW